MPRTTPISHLMTTKVHASSVDAKLSEVRHLLRKERCHHKYDRRCDDDEDPVHGSLLLAIRQARGPACFGQLCAKFIRCETTPLISDLAKRLGAQDGIGDR